MSLQKSMKHKRKQEERKEEFLKSHKKINK